MLPANQLIGELNRIGVKFVVGEVSPKILNSISPRKLMAGLTTHNDARIRLALIPVLLLHPEYAIDVLDALELLDDSKKVNFKLYYTAAHLLQLAYCNQLKDLIGTCQVIPDYFSEDLNIPKEGTSQDRLRHLAERHREITNMSVNWLGTYHHAAKRLLTRMQKEREWAKV